MRERSAEKPKAVRLFAALDLPEGMRKGLEAWGARELTGPALRPVPAENLHMTVCFLGWTVPNRVAEAAAIVAAVEPCPVAMRLLPELVGKPARRPSLFALEAEAPQAAVIASELTAALCEQGLAEPEDRPFWPHLTVARVRAERAEDGRRRRVPMRLERPPGPLPPELGGEFRAVRLCLYRSMMRRDGSQYVPIHNVDLR